MDKDINVSSLIASLQKTLGNKVIRYSIRKLGSPEQIERILSIYAGLAKPSGYKEKTILEILKKALSKSLLKFGIEEDELKKALKDPYMRKGIANILLGIAYFGITRPQKLYAPFMVVWDFTKQCNLRCKHCYANAGSRPSPDELTLEQKLKVLQQLDEAGVAAISFSGGEPLINKDFWTVAEEASEYGMYVSVATNGTLITENIAKKLREINVRYIEVSFRFTISRKA